MLFNKLSYERNFIMYLYKKYDKQLIKDRDASKNIQYILKPFPCNWSKNKVM